MVDALTQLSFLAVVWGSLVAILVLTALYVYLTLKG